MRIGGFQATTFADFPGEVAAIIFTVGCNLRCGYCHNSQLVTPRQKTDLIPTAKVMDTLKERSTRLTGVVFTGGEPLLQPDVLEHCRILKDLGYRIKLDSNGTHPLRLTQAIQSGLIDYVALDVKDVPGKPPRYGPCLAPECLQESINLVISSGIAHEFRTTVSATLHDTSRLCAIADTIQGGKQWWLQRLRPSTFLDPNFPEAPLDNRSLEAVQDYAASIHLPCSVR
ncbi:MAG: anaerobic ribonucleoside-triphosphate reductase activating protein [Planctomycetota bacterium]|nr:MAG: anaerobic ribonucleoside-triphosphate reductase activating protein [Planctomycetota bacterium]